MQQLKRTKSTFQLNFHWNSFPCFLNSCYAESNSDHCHHWYLYISCQMLLSLSILWRIIKWPCHWGMVVSEPLSFIVLLAVRETHASNHSNWWSLPAVMRKSTWRLLRSSYADGEREILQTILFLFCTCRAYLGMCKLMKNRKLFLRNYMSPPLKHYFKIFFPFFFKIKGSNSSCS